MILETLCDLSEILLSADLASQLNFPKHVTICLINREWKAEHGN